MRGTAIVWFRNDLRLRDNPALRYACNHYGAVLPVYIWSPEKEGVAAPGAASRVWLHYSLQELADRIDRCGAKLIIEMGDPAIVLVRLAKFVAAGTVLWNRRYEPPLAAIDAQVRTALLESGCEPRSFKANLLVEPWEVSTGNGRPYRVFTPFWKNAESIAAQSGPVPGIRNLVLPERVPTSRRLCELQLLPNVPWDAGIRNTWEPGEVGAQKRLRCFLARSLSSYAEARDFPDRNVVSRLSPHLHFGEISPRQIGRELQKFNLDAPDCRAYWRQLGWREFAHHVLHHFPYTVSKPLQPAFGSFAWRADASALRAWQTGRTGYPIVDAGMRELWESGWMHNRVRMIVASFLVKHLLTDWRIGAAWFWDTLVDADLANNTLGWQWAAGCGADAAPYFRVFNPTRQGETFDPGGAYVRRWVPELAPLPDKWIHRPWMAPQGALADAGIVLGTTYPRPIVDHATARTEALRRFSAMK